MMNMPQRLVLVVGGLIVLTMAWFAPFEALTLLVRIFGVAVATAFIWFALKGHPVGQ